MAEAKLNTTEFCDFNWLKRDTTILCVCEHAHGGGGRRGERERASAHVSDSDSSKLATALCTMQTGTEESSPLLPSATRC